MRAMVMDAVVNDVADPLLRMDDVPVPVAGRGDDVVVKVAGSGVCRSDLHILLGSLEVSTPHVLGHETAGWVATVGPDVRTVAVGDPVVCYPFVSGGLSPQERRGLDSAAPDRTTPGIDAPGGYAEYVLTNERAMVPLPSDADPVQFAPLGDAGVTAYRASVRAATDAGPGDVIVVVGVGGLGHLAVQILRKLSAARIVAVDKRSRARRLAIECGADDVLAADEAPAAIRDAAAVVDFVGTNSSLQSGLDMLGFGGRLVVVGVDGELRAPAIDLVVGERSVEGVYVGTYDDLVMVTRLTVDGDVTPRIATYALEDAELALRDLGAGRVLGRAVLVP